MTLTLTASGISPCLDATDDMVITISPQVTADAGADATICVGDSYNLSGTSAPNNAGVSWTHNGNGTITDDNTLTPTYNSVSTDGPTVTLTLTASGISPCLDATDDMVITISPQVTADAGADATICVGDSYNLSGTSAPNNAGVSWTHNGNGTITG